jgi:hypothetical protein
MRRFETQQTNKKQTKQQHDISRTITLDHLYDIISEQAPDIRNPQNLYISIDSHSTNDKQHTRKVQNKKKPQIRKTQQLIALILKHKNTQQHKKTTKTTTNNI